MMGTQSAPAQLFYDFDLERHVPDNHMLREIDRFLDVDGMRQKLRSFYSHTGRPSIDPELIVRMLVIGYAMGIRSERRLCDEGHLNLAYRWFCRLGVDFCLRHEHPLLIDEKVSAGPIIQCPVYTKKARGMVIRRAFAIRTVCLFQRSRFAAVSGTSSPARRRSR